MGVKAAIPKLMPSEWYYVLKKHRKIYAYVRYIYDRYAPIEHRNKYKANVSMTKARIVLSGKYPITHTFDIVNSKEGADFWKKIESEINEYIEQCR